MHRGKTKLRHNLLCVYSSEWCQQFEQTNCKPRWRNRVIVKYSRQTTASNLTQYVNNSRCCIFTQRCVNLSRKVTYKSWRIKIVLSRYFLAHTGQKMKYIPAHTLKWQSLKSKLIVCIILLKQEKSQETAIKLHQQSTEYQNVGRLNFLYVFFSFLTHHLQCNWLE